ncbi:hypothetical protein DYB26_013201 [Aphanomyces astaci]|uniref:DDE-1 domain-containing protein n=1 Tax=Aphanomyces astaci TaxID=112090 RepID=A0A418EH03_APHAT|nr:hypothetical protein DYB26_013201 [Aphanomyces astaci]
MYYSLPPTYIWAVRGGSAKISTGGERFDAHDSGTNGASGRSKAALLLIMKEVPGGLIKSKEFPTFPRGHHYAMQENAWMDAVVWRQYLRDCHVSDESFKIMHEELGSHLCALPPNATSVCQPFDVGVMAPFKRNLRNLWLYEEQLEGDDDDPYSPTARQK